MNDVYRNPKYYDIAFSFRDIEREVDVFERIIKKYSHIPVSRVLELGCGPAPYLEELTHREYDYTGLDLSSAMLEYAQSKADAIDAPSKFLLADMTNFELDEEVDFAFVLLGSLHARNSLELASHFDCVSRSLKFGGLYFLDWCISFTPGMESIESWEMIQGQVKVKATSHTTLIDPVNQIVKDSLLLEVEDQGLKKEFREIDTVRQIYPQEFLLFISDRSDFEFVGWWNNWDVKQPLDQTKKVSRPITVLRKV
jgi:SAM-dependent methyltransferase